MKKNVVAPSVGESITEVSILKWAKKHGEAVKPGDLLLEIESDKATVEVVAESAGTLQIDKQAGERVAIGAVLGFIDDSIAPTTASSAAAAPAKPATPQATPTTAASTTPSSSSFAAAQASHGGGSNAGSHPSLSPSVRRASAQHGIDPSQLHGSGKDGRVTKGDVMNAVANPPAARPAAPAPSATPAPSAVTMPKYIDQPGDRRVPMSMLRQKIAERLVYAQHTAAILTTFNEVDMSTVMKIRAEHKDKFKAKHGVNLSFMSFFTKAVCSALQAIPEVNATIDGKDIVYHDYMDVGIAVGTERGLVVPIVRGADKMDFLQIEKKIAEFAVKARDGKLNMADMAGGTFTISNGGTYGSLMSTPILNPPQSGILGMHKIMDRPMAVNGKVEIRPMMYVALSYDHRIIDGKGAVTFLVHLKEFLESAEKINLSY